MEIKFIAYVLLTFIPGIDYKLWTCKEIEESSNSQAHPLQVDVSKVDEVNLIVRICTALEYILLFITSSRICRVKSASLFLFGTLCLFSVSRVSSARKKMDVYAGEC